MVTNTQYSSLIMKAYCKFPLAYQTGFNRDKHAPWLSLRPRNKYGGLNCSLFEGCPRYGQGGDICCQLNNS